MLDTETKNRIDTARDILVGKVPDPKSQVEQITIALIYKFMDDMDKESISLGGKATFFSGDYKKYSWTNIFDPKIGGHEMLALYSEAIVKLNVNPNIPQLFRDIFKNAYLPYRDPETLKLFLKTINEFQYDHSEKLGDAFEYLLSILGSQGDAGQFRTPRHIIDFIVEVLQPKKNETICDPACGTAGFLISAYKYILKSNRKNVETRHALSLLTPEERTKMMQNITGYDISPDMVRLSLANLYLHGFSKPGIHEYDTLTSEERWNEYYDVILANPPFMSPKGGIKPHKKFSIQANRSEVLFVDYIAEHIHPGTGRAGIIVPEGIIFQSAGAYKQLRKMLVDKNFLYAVVSLPAGIFQPYSGVKTSILLMDKTLAKKTDNILFVKIENDGFDLGAQRRAIDKNDLTGCLELLQQYKKALQKNTVFESDNKNVFLVEKDKIVGNADYNLSIDRYRINEIIRNNNLDWVTIEEICTLVRGSSPRPQGDPRYYGGNIPRLMISDITRDGMYTEPITDFLTIEGAKLSRPMKKGDVIMAVSGNPGIATILKVDACIHDGFVGFRNLDKRILPQFFYYSLIHQKEINHSQSVGAVFKNLNTEQVRKFQIPLPSISIQQQIVTKIESYQKIIDGAKQVVENYKPQIDIDESWEMVKLGEVCDFKRGPFGGSLKKEIFVSKGFKVYEQKNAIRNNFDIGKYFIDENKFKEMQSFEVLPNDLIISCSGTMGKIAIAPEKMDRGIINQALLKLTPRKDLVHSVFIKTWLESNEIQNKYFRDTSGAAIQNVASVRTLKEIPFPNLPLNTQQEIVTRIEQEQQLVNANKELTKLYEQKIKDEINKLWVVNVKEK